MTYDHCNLPVNFPRLMPFFACSTGPHVAHLVQLRVCLGLDQFVNCVVTVPHEFLLMSLSNWMQVD